MELEEILKTKERNYEEEKRIIEDLSSILKPYISLEDIKKRLEINGFNGVYILDRKTFSLISNSPKTIGVYDPNEKVVIIDETHYAVNKKYGVHEMGHAYLDGRNERKITFNGSDITYGIGLEEGAMSILEVTSNIQDINKRNCTSYPLQAKLFHQLNALYGYSNVKEYKNLLLHLFVEPEKFIPLIRDIYDDIYKEQLSDFKHILSDKSALAMVSGTDSLIDYDAGNLNGYLNYLNSLYLNVADEDVRNERYFDNMFISAKDFLRTNDEVLYFNIFGNDKLYYERQQRHLETLLGLINEELEKISIQTDNDRNKVFVRR